MHRQHDRRMHPPDFGALANAAERDVSMRGASAALFSPTTLRAPSVAQRRERSIAALLGAILGQENRVVEASAKGAIDLRRRHRPVVWTHRSVSDFGSMRAAKAASGAASGGGFRRRL